MVNSPTISGADSETAIVLVAHSMGGLVIKKALLQARQDPNCRRLCRRIHSMFFLATPHRGSDSAHLLKNLLSLSSSKSYIGDLQKGSMSTQLINDEFRNAYWDIQLWSFFETLPTTGLGIVVDRDSAVLGLPAERIQLMNANHRNICKFADRFDSNYMSLRNAFVSCVDSIKKEWIVKQRQAMMAQLQTISEFLGVTEGPEADLTRVRQKQTPGTCQWLTESQTFIEWSNFTDPTRVFWLEGEPATGKSTTAGHAIEYLETANGSCAYFFFKHGDSTKSALANALLSLAWQMAHINSEIRADLQLMAEQGAFLDRTDESSVWRSVFQMRIFKLSWKDPWYWVLDALDECANHMALLPLLAKLENDLPLKILITSRPVLAIDRGFQQEGLPRVSETVAISRSLSDIQLFLSKNSGFLPVENEHEKEKLLTRILNRSNGNFLWTFLVLQELADTPSVQQAYEVLDSVPTGMEGLYARILETVMSHPRNSRLARAILKWCVCVTRPLTVEELKDVLKLDLRDSFPRLEQTINSITGNLVIVDANSRVQLAHQTVRSYLMQENVTFPTKPEYAIVKSRDNLSLSDVCLDYLCGSELKVPRHRRGSAQPRSIKRSAFANYAAAHFSDHVVRSSIQDAALFNKLHAFFATNVMTWIEIVASQRSLAPIIATARNVKSYLEKRSKYMAPLDQKVRDLKTWANDLSYLVTSFGKPLLESPHSIHFIIPPVCPSTSMIYRASSQGAGRFRMHGLEQKEWDDRVACLAQPGMSALAVTSRNEKFALGFSDGIVRIHDSSTMQQTGNYDHKESVRYVEYSKTGDLLATASWKNIKVWETGSNRLKWQHRLKDSLMCISFTKDSNHLVTASRANDLMLWDVETSQLVNCAAFTDIDEATGQEMKAQKTPIRVEYSPDLDILAVVYRQRPAIFWDLEENPANPIYIGSYNKDTATYPGPLNFALAFNPCVELIAASYDDGEVVVIDPFTQRTQARATEGSALLRSSKDGEVLASADGEGTITLFEFETLRRMYRIRSYPLTIRDLDFSSDGLQVLEVRSDHCNVWQPAALVRSTDLSDDSMVAEASGVCSDDYSHIPETSDVSVFDDDKTITALAVSSKGLVFSGREDGSMALFSASDGKIIQELEPYTRQIGIAVVCISVSGVLFASINRAGRVLVLQIDKPGVDLPKTRLDKRAEDVVVEVLFTANDKSLLISMNQRDELWDLESKSSIVRESFSDTARRHWMLHPSIARTLLFLEGAYLSSLDLANFAQHESPTRVNVAEDITHATLTTAFVGNHGNPQLCIFFAPHRDGSSSAKLRICDGLTASPTSWRNSSPHGIVTKSYDRLAKDLKYAIGMQGSSFYFLTHNGWICSLETAGGRERPYYTRHFFVPFRFHSNASAILLFVTSDKNIVLAYMSNVIVFVGALDLEESVVMDEKALSIRPSMRSTQGRSRTSPI